MLRILYIILIGYLVYKAIQFFKKLFTITNSAETSQKVYGNTNVKTKIDKNDVIDAQFEEIEIKDKSSSSD